MLKNAERFIILFGGANVDLRIQNCHYPLSLALRSLHVEV